MAGRVIGMNDLQQQQFKRKIRHAISEIDAMKAHLTEVRICCIALASAMREFREQSQQAQLEAIKRGDRQRLRQQLKVVS